MFLDLTVRVTPELRRAAEEREQRASFGHLGTHFDVMNGTFPLEYFRRAGLAVDVRAAGGREITGDFLPWDRVRPGQFLLFRTGWAEQRPYGSPDYFHGHPVLSRELIHALVERKVSLIGVDCPGVRRGAEHPAADQFCADGGTFVIENLCHLAELLGERPWREFPAYVFPLNQAGLSGLPCRVAAELDG